MVKRIALTLLLMSSIHTYAQSYDEAPAPTAPGRRPAWTLTARGGFPLGPADSQTTSRWTHNTFNSYLVEGGASYSFPRNWPEFYFFAGADFSYISSLETNNSSSGSSSLNTDMFQFFVNFGAAFEPYWLGGDWGAYFLIATEVWGQKETKLDTAAFNSSLGVQKTGVPMREEIGFYYKITKQWRPFLSYEYRNGYTSGNGFTMLSLGMNYGF